VRFSRLLSLRQLLTVPYLVLVLLLVLVLGLLSYRAGRSAVDDLSNRLQTETVGRIAQAVQMHVFGSGAVLETAFPTGIVAPDRVADAIGELRTRFWLATSVHRELNNYAYYGDTDGQFFGLWRDSDQDGQLRLRTQGEGPRSLYRFHGIHGALGAATLEERVFEPRERPWFVAARDADTETWTSIYIDFRTQELVATRARRVPDAQGQFRGVVATDVALRHLNDFVRTLPLSANGFAMILEADGRLIATSRGEHIRKLPDGHFERLNAASAGDPLIEATYASLRSLMNSPAAQGGTHATQFTDPDGGAVQMAYARIVDSAGLDWLIAVAVPRSDFLHEITGNVTRTVALGSLAAIATLAIGLLSLSSVAADLKALSRAARGVGEGDFDQPLLLNRRDEIGELADNFRQMKRRLLTDRLTGLANREAFTRRIDERIRLQRRPGDDQPFAVLFLDLNGFKAVNDRYGHDVGDAVLREVGARMSGALREEDLMARWSGDEFVVMLPRVETLEQARVVAGQLRLALGRPLESVPGHDVPLETAVGVAIYPADGASAFDLIRAADVAMYEDKRGSGDDAAASEPLA